MLKTRNIYIDTQVFVSNNYFQNENLKRLSDFGKSGVVNLYMTEITRQEIMDNAANDIIEAINDINEFKKKLLNKGKILKNIVAYRPYLDLPKAQVPENIKKIADDLQQFLDESRITMLPYDTANLNDVVTKYFKKAKPFGQGKKKHEFPDAIVISAIEHWCAQHNEKIYLISGDSDMEGLGSKNILPIAALKDMLNLINNDKTKRTAWIGKFFKKYEVLIEDRVAEAFSEKIVDELGELELEDVEISTIKIHEYFIVQDNIASGEFVLQFDYDIDFSTDVMYEDYSIAFFNKEDDRYLGVRANKSRVSMSTTQTAEVTIEAFIDEFDNEDQQEPDITCTYTSIPDAQRILDKIDNPY
ncbi:PIN domain-containing protein [Pedobacter sp. UC225_65]|uniref:PIN domain-containing protein n=1 Tax=Pedobacter sp. UC225_65 TaxID=3350173 RepID=UPI003671A542